MSQIRDSIEQYVMDQLKEYKPQRIRAPKVIHDTILGSNLFYAHEIAVLDLPILQRLRRINQVDVVPLVFPSGNHNRFEHTLGVTVIGEKLARAVKRKINEAKLRGDSFSSSIEMTEEMIEHVRLAAIMHDTGHGPFSHISEEVYKWCEDIKLERKENPRLQGSSPHEALSYLIVTSQAFRDFFSKHIENQYNKKFDLDLIGDMIVGFVEKPELAYLIDIINGVFDADKLDYIQRDSHFTGIKMVLDLDRLFYTVDVLPDKKGRFCLSVDLTGVSTLEQIVFNKMMLFSTVYNHHKVRAAECLFRSIFEEITKSEQTIYGLNFNSAADFLYLSDADLYSLSRDRDLGRISTLANDLCLRRLPKRAMVLSNRTVTKESLEPLQKVMELYEYPNFVMQFRETVSEVAEGLGYHVPVEEVWLDIPSGPKFKEGSEWPIKSLGSSNGYIRLRDIMPVDDWVKAFAENKWQGHIFTRPEFRKAVYESSKVVLKEVYGVEVNDYARILCKMDDELISSCEELGF